jgi:hypothetical protein
VTAIKPGAKVTARAIDGQLLERRAITEVIEGDDFPVVWVCREEEWNAARAEAREPEGFAWPAEDVDPNTATTTSG